MYVGLAVLSFWMDGCNDLNYRKNVLLKIKSRTKTKFNISIAQVDIEPDKSDFITIGISTVGTSSEGVCSKLKEIIDFIDSLSLGRIKDEKCEIINFEN